MKRTLIIGVLLLTLMLAVASSASAQWYDTDDRDTVRVLSATADINETDSSVGGVLFYEVNTTLPMEIGELDDTATYWHFQSTADNGTTHTLSVNGVALETDAVLANQSWSNKTLADAISAGVDEDDTYILLNISVNETGWLREYSIFADDGAILSAWITTALTRTQEDYNGSIPEIEGKWTVRDKLLFNNTLDFALADFDFNYAYPDTLFDSNLSTWENDTALPIGETTAYIIYRKAGPEIDIDDEDVIDTAGAALTNMKLTITFKSDDILEEATWDTDAGDVYDEYLSEIDEDSDLMVTVNGDEVDEDDIDIQEDTILLENLPDIDADKDNTIVFEWNAPESSGGGTTPGDTTTPPPEAPTGFLNEEMISGIPNWALLAIVAVIVIAIIAIKKIEK